MRSLCHKNHKPVTKIMPKILVYQISDAIKSSGNEITFTIDPSNRMPALSIVDSSINDQRTPMAVEGSSNQPHSGSKERVS